MEYASKSVGTAGLTTGIIGTALGALAGGTGLLTGANNASNQYVSQSAFDMQINYEKQLSDQAMQIAALEAEKISDTRDIEVYKQLRSEMNTMKSDLATRIATCEANVNAQAVYNATNTATIGCIQNQVAQLQAMTKLVIPIANVSPQPAVSTTTNTTT